MPQRPQPKPSNKTSPPGTMAPPTRPTVAPLQPLAPGSTPRSATSASSLPSPHHSRHRNSPSPSPHSSAGPLHPPIKSPPSRSRPNTPDPLHEMHELRYRHALELQAVKRKTLELREEKAYLVAQNFRLHRELAQEKHTPLPPTRERDSSRPTLGRSFSHPNADLPRGGLAALATVSGPTVAASRPASAAPVPASRPRTPSSASFGAPHVHHVPHPSLDSGHHRQRSSVGSASDYPFPTSRRSSSSGYGAAPDPATLSRPSSIRSQRSRTGSLASTSGRMTPASLASGPGMASTPATSSTRGRSQSRPGSSIGGGGSSDNLKGILKPPRNPSRDASLGRGGRTGGYMGEVDGQPAPAQPAGPRRRMSFDAGRLSAPRSTRPAMVTSF